MSSLVVQSEKVAAAEVHFQSAIRVLEALARMLPQEERVVKGRDVSAGAANEVGWASKAFIINNLFLLLSTKLNVKNLNFVDGKKSQA